MQKKKIFKIEDSNIEGIGTEADKECRKTAAATEKAWKKIKKGKIGFYAWRIEKFKVKVNNDALEGNLYDDDSYIFLKVTEDKEKKLHYDIHFWLGASTSQDEAGTAAYKTVELDDFFDGAPIQHRECSGFESQTFLSFFNPGSFKLLSGGCDSGFNHVEPEKFDPRLLWIKGKKNVRTVQVDMEIRQLNSGDVFILDAGLTLYQFQSKGAGKFEKSNAGQLTRAIDDERKGKPEVEVFSQLEKTSDVTMRTFFSYFQKDLKAENMDYKEGTPVSEEDCKTLVALIPDNDGGDDNEFEKNSNKRLMQLSDSDGEMKFTEVAKGKACVKSLLKSEDVFIFDIGCEIFVWTGNGASEKEKKGAMRYASIYLKKYERPMQMPVTACFEGGENEVFQNAFHGK